MFAECPSVSCCHPPDMSAPATSKTAKKKAGLTPVRIPEYTADAKPSEAPKPVEDGGAETDKTSSGDIPVKPTLSFKRRVKRQFEIPRVTFFRLVHEIASDFKSDLRFQREAVDALQEASETLVAERFARCSQLADLCKLDTVRDEHWRFVQNEGGLAVPCSGKS